MFRVSVSRTIRRAVPSTRMAVVAPPRCVVPSLPTVIARYESSSASSGSGSSVKDKIYEAQRTNLRDWKATKVTYEDIKPRTQAPPLDAYLIDVREPDEVLQGAIPSSVNLPLSVLPESLHLSPEKFKEQFGFEKPRKDQEIVFYCRSGKRSSTASDVALRSGFTKILNYEGSWLDWVAREGPPNAQQ